jgi:transposase, IS5 family
LAEIEMAQMGFFDADNRLTGLSAKGDPLVGISSLVPWESFRGDIEAVVMRTDEARKSAAGRKPIDALVLLRMLVLQSLYNLSDEQIEYQVRDRLSFTRFVGLGFEDGVPDGTTLWLFREKLAKAGLIDKLFERFGRHLEARGYIARGGQMVDATIVPVPRQRNSRDENDQVKTGTTPEDWKKRPSKNRQKGCALDEEAWTQLLRLQEPCECRCPTQADPRLHDQRCERARQPEARRSSDQGQYIEGRLRRQCLPLGRDGAKA